MRGRLWWDRVSGNERELKREEIENFILTAKNLNEYYNGLKYINWIYKSRNLTFDALFIVKA
jgi:hypothetical protein